MNEKRADFVAARRAFLAICLVSSVGFLSACNNPPASDQQLQEQAAKATEAAKKESAEALARAQVAAANAERAVNDVAAGVKQGFDSKTPANGGRVNVNSASAEDLSSLPGISAVKAARIIHHRPYASTHDLVKSGVLSENQFAAIAPKITVE